ncbi:nuclear transport factor 2 family protein [Pinirhizobacter sp.]|jgi:ketosteroid isomerase-like protein|uniref:nuclear transport factor 2 family protein n=1 Tax=Pinirhizobacter sp. TaxID=2950432 RepID=UPI002F3EDE28
MRRVAVLLLLAVPVASVWAVTSPEAEIKRLSQQFSDASASGDAATLGRLLDDRVVFMNESGELSSRADILASTQPTPAGRHNELVQGDWNFVLQGDTAVTSFTDNGTFTMGDVVLHARFKSIETWQHKKDGWKMIASQTLAVQDDPAAVTLTAADLDQYVGTYSAGMAATVKITRTPRGLESATNGGAAKELDAEVRDVLFTPGQPRTRRIIQRDAAGHVTGFIARREGHDLLYRKQAS